ncbi:MAG: hypothetical protein JXR85_11155, partial [Deltaproteobacteria bacterium]|nr:hypothetical protein [Deltaproteobacteria bacterium]
MKKTVFILLSLFLVLSANMSFADDTILFGPTELTIGKWYFHTSYHEFTATTPGDGILTVTGNDIWQGLILFNSSIFRIGSDSALTKTVSLKARNQMIVLLAGPPGASVIITVRAKGVIPPPAVTFLSEPSAIAPGEHALLKWTSTGADNVIIDQGIGSVPLNGSTVVSPCETTTYTLIATGEGGTTTKSVTVTVNQPPTVGISADPGTIRPGESTALTWRSVNADTCIIEPGIGSVGTNGSIIATPAETTVYTITATGPGGTATASATVTVHDPSAPPTVGISAAPATIAKYGSSILSWTSDRGRSAHIDNGIGTVSAEGSITVSPAHTTTYTITVTGETGSASATATVMVTGNPVPQPEGSFGEGYQDLIPPDATVEQYDARRFSVITGLVRSVDDVPIAGVSVTILGRPEYGTAITDADGRFSLPVEGGTTMTVIYREKGLIPAQRKVDVSWNDIVFVETVRMTAEDTASTTLIFDGSPQTVVTHRSTEVADEYGSRSCALVLTGDNTAYLVDEDGNDIQALTSITVRATEFTTPRSMPAILPPNSAYTYCAELAVDGVTRVRFDKPVITWVDNFLGFDVGEIVPVGYYDRDRGVWVPSDNGGVVKL